MNQHVPPSTRPSSGARSSLRTVGTLVGTLSVVAARLCWRWLRRTVVALRAGWQRLDHRRRLAISGSIAALLASWLAWSWRDVPHHWQEARDGKRPLLAAKSWHYNLSAVNVDRLTATKADLFVIDYAREDGDVALTRDEVARIKAGLDGKQRLVISYISIGEGESYRFYWNTAWSKDEPGWHVAENCSWPRNHMVRFWHDGWKDIIYRGKNSYLNRIIEAGFDGVYLDRIDVFHNLEKERPSARDDMVQFVREMAEAARKLKPGFLFIAQNAETLLADRSYRAIIDGLGKEDLLYGVQATNERNPQSETTTNKRLIRKLQWDWKPVFAVEYLSKPELIESARNELTNLDIVPTFAHRSLDGGDPLASRSSKETEYGTAEWTAKNCKDKPHW